MDSRQRLQKLAKAHEQVNQALLGAHWEERFALYQLKEKIEHEIRSLTEDHVAC